MLPRWWNGTKIFGLINCVFMHLNTGIYKLRNRGPFVERPSNFSGPESCFMFAVFNFENANNEIIS